ncbi:hypothetical protein [Bradyrhizobium sp. JR3.5]
MLQAASLPSQEPTTTSLSQFLYTHEKLRNLARGPLPRQIVDEMTDTACGIAEKMLEAPAADWHQLVRKVQVLLEELSDEAQWIEKIKDTLREDEARLSLAEAAEQQPFFGARCSSYPACSGGCGLGCSHEMAEAAE